MIWDLVLPAAATLVGSLTARVTGLGFALIAAPFYVVAFGPSNAVAVIILIGAINASLVLWSLRAHVQWTRALLILLGGMFGAIPGTWALLSTPQRVLELSISVLLIVSLFVAELFPADRVSDTRSLRLSTGVAWGFFTTSAALGAPPLAIYSRLTGWYPPGFSASLQPLFIVSAAPFLLMRAAAGESWLPVIPGWTAAAIAVTIVVGVALGTLAASRLSLRLVIRAQFVIAIAGALFTGVRALVLWNA